MHNIYLKHSNMEKLRLCRICLSADVPMHVINTNLQDVYEKLTSMPLEAKDYRPLIACYLCCGRLQSCYQLRLDCLQSEESFAQILNSNMVQEDKMKLIVNRNRFRVSPVLHLKVGCSDQDDMNDNIKMEVNGILDPEVKMEQLEATEEEIPDGDGAELDNQAQSTDSEDDKPLKIIKTETERKLKRKMRKKSIVRKKELDVKSSFSIDAREIWLSKEEQMEHLTARSKSMNYTLSPYKCDSCYKGFVDSKAYDNHMMKHDKRSGCHVCEICRVRYSTAQHLKTHVVTAHSRLFKCNKCGHVTHTANQARVHEKWHSGYTYECQLCGHKFRKPTSYLSHMRKRHPTENVCDICGESFVGKHGLQMHKSKTHKNDAISENNDEPPANRYCKDCNIQFHNRDAWQRHILCSVKHKLTNEAGSECKICGWRGNSTTVVSHMREHSRSLRQRRPIASHVSDRTPCHCTQCGMKFVSRTKLQAHVNRMHLGLKYNKNIVCEVCGKHCTSNATLKYHQRTHTGERPYSCSTCSKHFTDSNQLRIHVRTHTGEKPYECAVCGKRFSQKPALNRHYRVHTGDKPYVCQHCSRTFSQSNSLKLHVRTVHLKLPANRKKSQEIKIEQKSQTVDSVN